MVQKLLEFLLSLHRVSITWNTRFQFALDAWITPVMVGVMILAMLTVFIVLLWSLVKRLGHREKQIPGLMISGASLLILLIWLPFSFMYAARGAHGPQAFSVILAAIVVGAVGFWSYQAQSTSHWRRIWLGVIRGALLVVALLLFCRPELVVERVEPTRSVVAIWLDTSMSTTLQDPYTKDPKMREWMKKMALLSPPPAGQTRLMRYQLGVDSLGDAQWIKKLTETQDVEFFTGYTHAQLIGTASSPGQVPGIIADLKKITPTGDATDVPTVVQEIMQKVQGTRVSAIVLLTDGQTTESGSRLDKATEMAERTGDKIFSLPLGQADAPFDIALGSMQAPKYAFARDPVLVKVPLSCEGISGPTPIKLTLYRKQGEALTELTSKEFLLDPTKKMIEAELIFKPSKKPSDEDEKYDLVVKADLVGLPVEELNTANNVATGTTTIKDAQINVLLIDTFPRWEFRYLKNELIREKTVNVSSYLIAADENFVQDGNKRVPDKNDPNKDTFPGPITRFPDTKEELDKYDVIIIGDVDPTFFSGPQQKLILDFVRKSGGGIGWIAGKSFNPESYKGTMLEPLLPIIPDEIDPRARVMLPAPNEPFTLELTAAGKDSNLFRFFDDPDLNVKQMGELPEMYWYKPVLGLQPAAKVLAVHPKMMQGGKPVPLIVEGRYGNGVTLFSAVCDTWRWRRYTGEPLFQSYWLQMCRLLSEGKKLDQKGLEIAAENSRVEVGHPLKISMDIKDPTLSPLIPAQVPVMLTDAAGHVVDTIVMQRGSGEDGQEHFSGTTTASQVGDFSLVVGPGVLPLNLDPYPITIERPQREFESSVADMESLSTLASKTTGAVVPLYQEEELSKLIPDRSLLSMDTLSEELWYKPIALILMVGLLTAEWLMRKRAGLI